MPLPSRVRSNAPRHSLPVSRHRLREIPRVTGIRTAPSSPSNEGFFPWPSRRGEPGVIGLLAAFFKPDSQSWNVSLLIFFPLFLFFREISQSSFFFPSGASRAAGSDSSARTSLPPPSVPRRPPSFSRVGNSSRRVDAFPLTKKIFSVGVTEAFLVLAWASPGLSAPADLSFFVVLFSPLSTYGYL